VEAVSVQVPEGLEPLAIWEARDDAFWQRHGDSGFIFAEAISWAERHGVVKSEDRVYRIEFYLVDAPFAIVYRYALNEDGMVPVDAETGGPATEPPALLPLGELPPAHLLSP